MNDRSFPPIGFIGLGAMGEPMALKLAGRCDRLTVWNRTPEKCARLADAGAQIASSPSALCAASEIVFLMLIDGRAMDDALG